MEHLFTNIRPQLFGILQLLGREMSVGLYRQGGVLLSLPWVNINIFLTNISILYLKVYLDLFLFYFESNLSHECQDSQDTSD